jgi:hypothetical protein
MDAKTSLMQGIDAKDLAIGINIEGQVGPNRIVKMTLGVPMTMTLPDLNAFMDKAMSVLDRQNNMGIIEALKLELEKTEKDLAANQLNRADYEAKCMTDWEISNRKGEFRATESQRANLGNFDKTAKELRENRIPRIRKEIAALERKLQGE